VRPRLATLIPCSLLSLALSGCAVDGSDDELGSGVTGATGESEDSATTETSATQGSGSATEGSGSTTDSTGSGDTETGGSSTGESSSEGTGPGCSYPAGASEPMAVGEVLTPYRWMSANRADGSEAVLDLFNAPCDTDPVIDWSVHDLLVFISVPAW